MYFSLQIDTIVIWIRTVWTSSNHIYVYAKKCMFPNWDITLFIMGIFYIIHCTRLQTKWAYLIIHYYITITHSHVWWLVCFLHFLSFIILVTSAEGKTERETKREHIAKVPSWNQTEDVALIYGQHLSRKRPYRRLVYIMKVLWSRPQTK